MIAFRKETLQLKQEEMAKELEMTNAMLSHIELGKRTGSVDFWYKYYEKYGNKLEENDLDIWDLLYGKERKK